MDLSQLSLGWRKYVEGFARNKTRVSTRGPDTLIGWLALVDGYCYVGRQRSWTLIMFGGVRCVVLWTH
jgi:hypothetical protein